MNDVRSALSRRSRPGWLIEHALDPELHKLQGLAEIITGCFTLLSHALLPTVLFQPWVAPVRL